MPHRLSMRKGHLNSGKTNTFRKRDDNMRRENGKKEAFIISSRWPVIERWAVVGCGVCIIDWCVVCY